MIKSIKLIPRITKGKYSWAHSLPFLKKKLEFKPGLNILFGPNGSGKSTVTGMLAHGLAAEQGGVSTVTQKWLGSLTGFMSDASEVPFTLSHDGQPVLYVNPRVPAGLSGGGFDDDFFNLGVGSCMTKGSTGQLTYRSMLHVLEILRPLDKKKPKEELSFQHASEFPKEIDWRIKPSSVNDTWKKKVAMAKKMLAASIELGPPTIILDEPESGFSIPWQAVFWQKVVCGPNAKKFQLIIATHSPFALLATDANFIETTPGYLQECKEAMKLLSV